MSAIPSDKTPPPYVAPDIRVKVPRTKEKHFAKVSSLPGAPRHEDKKTADTGAKVLLKKDS